MLETLMAKARDPFFMALGDIRDRARCGVYPPGRPVVIIDEARRLRISTTPVREAMAALCGEGVLERGPSGGFLAVRLDGAVVRDLYEFRCLCLFASLDLTVDLPRSPQSLGAGPDAVGDLRAALQVLVRRTGNAILADAFERAGGRLHRLAEPERRVLGDVVAEAERLLVRVDAHDVEALRDDLRAYHHRRREAADILLMDLAGIVGAASAEGAE